MSSPWVPLYLPLIKGLNLSKEPMLSGEQLTLAENIDWGADGHARGRPSRAAPKDFAVRDPAGTILAPTYLADVAFNSAGFTPNGLMRLRDGSGARPMLGCNGRIFSQENTRWEDKGHFACARVDRVYTYGTTAGDDLTIRPVMGPDFGAQFTSLGDFVKLIGSDYEFERLDPVTTGALGYAGGMARCGTTTATLARDNAANNLRILLRANGADTVTDAVIATDAPAVLDDGDAPSICCSHDATVFWVAYQTTVADQYKVLRVTTAGVVTHTFTGSLAGIHGIWVDNGTVASDRVVVAVTNASGLTLKMLVASTCTDAALDSTVAAATGAKDVVVGVESSTRAWWAFRAVNAAATKRDLLMGTVNPGSAASAVTGRRYYSGEVGATFYLVHQPVLVGGRMYLSIGVGSGGIYANAVTWVTMDLSNWKVSTSTTGGPFTKPTLVARGGDQKLVTMDQPESAVVLADGSGWTFITHEWSNFNVNFASVVTGQNAVTGLNRITFSGPRAVLSGGSTIISGSVPHMIAGEHCYEVGFPVGGPNLTANYAAGGTVTNGTYSLVAVWVYTDEAGQTFRSPPSPPRDITTNTGNNTLQWDVTNPWITERNDGAITIELYSTEMNPIEDSPYYLQDTISVNSASTSGKSTGTRTTPPDTTTQILYTYGGGFINNTPPGDGGVAVLGSRVWLATGSTAYASQLPVPGLGTAWNNEGSLQVNLPAGAGRIVALEGMDDKLFIFCERGVYVVQDGGPDNTGQGADFSAIYRVTDLGCAGPRSTCVTDRGVAFCTPLDVTDPQRGGPWIIERSLQLADRSFLGQPALDYLLAVGDWVPELAFSPERQQLYVSIPKAYDLVTVGASDTGVLVIDMRGMKWSTWAHQDTDMGDLRHIEVVGGVLWTLGNEPAPFNGVPGTDVEAGDYTMRLATTHLYANGQSGAGWGRVRSIRPWPAVGGGAHNLTMTVVQDQMRSSTSGAVAVAAAVTGGTTWPSTMQAPEWRLPVQKCSSIQVDFQASPANARWAAIRLDVAPTNTARPTGSRS